MTLAGEVKKIKESKAFYAAAGAGDLAVEKLREVPRQLRELQTRTDAKDLSNTAVTYASQVSAKTNEFIDELAERGKGVVGRVQRQRATQELEASVEATTRRARQAKGTAQSTAKSATETAKAAGKAAKDAGKKVGN